MKKTYCTIVSLIFLTACSNNTGGKKIATLHLLKYQLSDETTQSSKKIVVIRTQHQLLHHL